MADVIDENIYYGLDLTDEIKSCIDSSALVVTDGNVAALYPDLTENAFVIEAGEKHKTPDTLFSIIRAMHARGMTRRDRVIALGGGVVGDVAGLAAALYMRGVKWVSVPTTLLAMTDSGIGGKTAIDFDGVKNLVGAFHSPCATVVSAKFLSTLPDREWLCGYGELIKTCLLTESSFVLLKQKLGGLLGKNIGEMVGIIEPCLRIKNDVVKEDPKECGRRKILNVGHTVGHALESIDGYALSHGEYVLKGMMTECAMCKEYIDGEFYSEILEIFKSFTSPPRSTAKFVCEKAKSDKKNADGLISIMLPVRAGEITEIKLSPDEFTERYTAAIKDLK